jgi:hypothetical protein
MGARAALGGKLSADVGIINPPCVIQVIEKIRLTGARMKDDIILRVFRAFAHLPTMEQPQGQQRLTMPDRMVVGNLRAKAAV